VTSCVKVASVKPSCGLQPHSSHKDSNSSVHSISFPSKPFSVAKRLIAGPVTRPVPPWSNAAKTARTTAVPGASLRTAGRFEPLSSSLAPLAAATATFGGTERAATLAACCAVGDAFGAASKTGLTLPPATPETADGTKEAATPAFGAVVTTTPSAAPGSSV